MIHSRPTVPGGAHARALAEFSRICTGVDMHFGAVIMPGVPGSTMRPATRFAHRRAIAHSFGRSKTSERSSCQVPRPAAGQQHCRRMPSAAHFGARSPTTSLACGANSRRLVNGNTVAAHRCLPSARRAELSGRPGWVLAKRPVIACIAPVPWSPASSRIRLPPQTVAGDTRRRWLRSHSVHPLRR